MPSIQDPNTRFAVAVGAGLGASILTILAINRWKKRASYWNSPFLEAGRVDRLFVYPIKSCRGVEVSNVDCTLRGPRNGSMIDREFLVIDEKQDGMFLNARIYPKMVLIEAARLHNLLIVRLPNGKQVEVDLDEVKRRNDVREGNLYDNARTDGLDCGDEVGQALTEFLGLEGKRSLRLIQFSPKLYTERDPVSNQKFWLNPIPKVEDHMTFADETSYMINTKPSIDDLNKRLESDGLKTIDIRYFRPVISVNECELFDEDRWLEVRIGDAEFICFRPCSRCVLTTVDPDEGTLSKEMQPLKKLREYRLAPKGLIGEYKQSPLFGVHLALRRPGRIRVGDTVYARYKPSPFCK
ncbi:MOSC domain-containing protein [Aphelenchoides bicaudatus]|nr:MOSC domain-containing protein [Aphelenchoides bicaudatus]